MPNIAMFHDSHMGKMSLSSLITTATTSTGGSEATSVVVGDAVDAALDASGFARATRVAVSNQRCASHHLRPASGRVARHGRAVGRAVDPGCGRRRGRRRVAPRGFRGHSTSRVCSVVNREEQTNRYHNNNVRAAQDEEAHRERSVGAAEVAHTASAAEGRDLSNPLDVHCLPETKN